MAAAIVLLRFWMLDFSDIEKFDFSLSDELFLFGSMDGAAVLLFVYDIQ